MFSFTILPFICGIWNGHLIELFLESWLFRNEDFVNKMAASRDWLLMAS